MVISGGEVLGHQNDRRGEVGEGPRVRHFPLGFHGLGGFSQRAPGRFAADDSEVLIAAGLLEDDSESSFSVVLSFRRALTRSASSKRCSMSSARRVWMAK